MTINDKLTKFSTKETDSVVATEAMSLVLVETDKTIVLGFLMDHVSCLVGRYAIKGFSLDKGKADYKMYTGIYKSLFQT